jgi:hypothetical protein
MKIAATIARLLLGAIFLSFGSNLFLHFLPMGPMPAGAAGQFFAVLATTHYIYAIAFFQVAPAILLLINRYVPLGLALLAPVVVNIFLVHLLMAPSGLPVALVVAILWIVVALGVRSAFAGLLQRRVEG